MLMKTLLKVATKYKTVLMSNAFPTAFLEPLLRMSLVADPGIRRIVQEILQTLFDRHDNIKKLNTVTIPKDIAELNLTIEKPQRQDIMFMKKVIYLVYFINLLASSSQCNILKDKLQWHFLATNKTQVKLLHEL
jgi:hypothetical protein